MTTLKEIIKSKPDRLIAIELLERVKAVLAEKRGWLQYVCIHLSSQSHTDKENRLSNKLRKEIHRRLGKNYGTVTAWLEMEAGVTPYLMTDSQTREYRIRWIDSMIAELR